MQLGMVGLGRMGANIVRRLMRRRPRVRRLRPQRRNRGSRSSRRGRSAPRRSTTSSRSSSKPRAAWVMVPAAATGDGRERARGPHGAGRHRSSTAATATTATTSTGREELEPQRHPLRRRRHERRRLRARARLLPDDRRRARDRSQHLDPIFKTIAPGVEGAPRTPGRSGEPSTGRAGLSALRPAGAGHFVKMVHNGIEYGMMAAYAEGFNILRHANVGKRTAAPAMPRRRRCATRSTTSTTSTSPRSPRCGGAAAWSHRGCST